MSDGEDGKKGRGGVGYGLFSGLVRSVCCFLITLLILAGITALVLYLVYRPSKPRFSVVGAAVYDLNASSAAVYDLNASSPAATAISPAATAISTSMQFTVVSRNPNARSSIYYDRLAAYVSYRDQAITPPAPLPPLWQDTESTVAVSPVLGGGFVPVSPEVASGLVTDQAYGVVSLRLVVMGRLKYKAGPFRSPWYGMFVKCDLLAGLKKGMYGQVPLLGQPECSVDL